jgi:hypothetical protein
MIRKTMVCIALALAFDPLHAAAAPLSGKQRIDYQAASYRRCMNPRNETRSLLGGKSVPESRLRAFCLCVGEREVALADSANIPPEKGSWDFKAAAGGLAYCMGRFL